MLTAIETTGTIEQNGQITINEMFTVNKPTVVRVIVLFPEDDDFNEKQWLQTARQNEVFDFLDEESENIYSLTDGKAIER